MVIFFIFDETLQFQSVSKMARLCHSYTWLVVVLVQFTSLWEIIVTSALTTLRSSSLTLERMP